MCQVGNLPKAHGVQHVSVLQKQLLRLILEKKNICSFQPGEMLLGNPYLVQSQQWRRDLVLSHT